MRSSPLNKSKLPKDATCFEHGLNSEEKRNWGIMHCHQCAKFEGSAEDQFVL